MGGSYHLWFAYRVAGLVLVRISNASCYNKQTTSLRNKLLFLVQGESPMEVPGNQVPPSMWLLGAPSSPHLVAWPSSRAAVGKRSRKGTTVKGFGFAPHIARHNDLTLPLQHKRPATDDTEMDRCGCVPVKLDLQKQAVGRMWFPGCRLPTPVLRYQSHRLEPPSQPADRGRERRISRERS